MNIEKLENEINTCHKIIALINPGSDLLEKYNPDELQDLDKLEIKNIHATILHLAKSEFLEKCQSLRPLLNGDLSSIARTIKSIHKSTFRNYIDGYPKDPEIMLTILTALLKKAENNKLKYLAL